MESLSFDEVCADDPAVTGGEYVQVPADVLPELTGVDFWWHILPPSGEWSMFCCAQSPASLTYSEPESRYCSHSCSTGGDCGAINHASTSFHPDQASQTTYGRSPCCRWW